MSSTVQLGLSTQQCGHLCRHALWLPPYDLGLEADSGMSEATVDERKLISKFRARCYLRLGLVYKRGATDARGTQTRKRQVFLE